MQEAPWIMLLATSAITDECNAQTSHHNGDYIVIGKFYFLSGITDFQ